MPIISPGGYFRLEIHHCQKWLTLPDLIMALEYIQNDFNLITLQRGPSEIGPIIAPQDLATYCEANYNLNADWDNQNFDPLSPQGELYIAFRPSFFESTASQTKKLHLNMHARKYGDAYNFIEIYIRLDRRTDYFAVDQTIYPNSTLIYGEKVMQLYSVIGQRLIELLAPDYLWMAEDDFDAPLDFLYGRDILARRLETIFWINYFEPSYLTPEAESLFLNAPVGIVKHMADGIWYQLHEEFETVPWQEAERIEEQVKFHFSSLNLDRVQWRFMPG